LRAALDAKAFITAPGIFDMISARVADGMGFPCLYATGFGMVASHLGVADAGIATYTDMVARAGAMARGSRTPVIADADTGYGGLLNVRHTVLGYEARASPASSWRTRRCRRNAATPRAAASSGRGDGAQDQGRR
jgi:2-methylisocitrate lyase-like PEP mutase family enzyme